MSDGEQKSLHDLRRPFRGVGWQCRKTYLSVLKANVPLLTHFSSQSLTNSSQLLGWLVGCHCWWGGWLMLGAWVVFCWTIDERHVCLFSCIHLDVSSTTKSSCQWNEARARRCYSKAGFKFESSSVARWGSKGHAGSEWQRWRKVLKKVRISWHFLYHYCHHVMGWIYRYICLSLFIHGCLIIMVDVSDYNPWVCWLLASTTSTTRIDDFAPCRCTSITLTSTTA